MKFPKNFSKRKWVPYAIAGCVVVLFYLLLSHIAPIFACIARFLHFFYPVFMGIVIAYILNPFAMLFEKYLFRCIPRPRFRHALSVICALVVVLVGITILFVALIPQLFDSVTQLFQNLDNYFQSLQNMFSGLNQAAKEQSFDITLLLQKGKDMLFSFESALPQDLQSVIGLFGNIGNGVLDGVISFIMAIYFLMDKDRLLNAVKRFLKLIMSEHTYQNSGTFWLHCNRILVRYIGCDLLDGLIIGVANFIFMSIVDYPYAVLVSVVVGVTNLAPTFGPILGGAIGAFVLVLVNPWYALWFLIFTCILQTIDGYVLKPKMFGEALSVSSVWILICIIVGSRMFGFWGILLAIPFAAISDYFYTEFILQKLKNFSARRKQQEKKEQKETDDKAEEEQAKLTEKTEEQ